MAQSKSVQLRWRVSPQDKERLDELVAEGGYSTLSDLLRGVMLDSHLVVVGTEAGFFLCPAQGSTDDQRAEARALLEQLLAAAARVQEELSDPQPGQPATDLEEPVARPAAPAEGTAPPPPAPVAGDDFAALLASHDPTVGMEEQLADAAAPAATLEEDEAFVSRRAAELRLEGNTPLTATALAEAELRQRRAAAEEPAVTAEPALEPLPERLPGERPREDRPSADGRGACPVCGTPSAGTTFCASCGANLALASSTTNGDQPQ